MSVSHVRYVISVLLLSQISGMKMAKKLYVVKSKFCYIDICCSSPTMYCSSPSYLSTKIRGFCFIGVKNESKIKKYCN